MVNERLGKTFDNHCDNYPLPLTVQPSEKILYGKADKSAKVSFAADYAKKHSYVPGPGKMMHDDWSKLKMSGGKMDLE